VPQRSKAFQYRIQTEGQQTTIYLQGPLDQSAKFDLKLEPNRALTFNFREVTLLSSRGILSWQDFIAPLRGTKIYLEECPTLVVRQMNIVPSFLAHATVKSVYLAYTCENCEVEKLILIEASQFAGGRTRAIPGEMACEACGKGTMEPDTPLDQYFAFAR